MTPRLRISDENYKYVGEGNRNLVVSLTGTGKVLRLRKADEGADRAPVRDELLFEARFHEAVMRPSAGLGYTHPTSVVALQGVTAEQLNGRVHHERPHHRLQKMALCEWAVLAEDLTSDETFRRVPAPTLCVELKCKQGRTSASFVRYNKCSFCMKQFLKLEKKSINCISGYCPLDLFSGDVSRMSRSLDGLMENPQNNFKLFVSSARIDGGRSHIVSALNDYFHSNTSISDSIKAFKSILINALLWNGTDSIDTTSIDDLGPWDRTYCDDSKFPLPFNCVLDKILQIQNLEEDVFLEVSKNDSQYSYAYELLDLVDSIPDVSENNIIDVLKRNATDLQKYMLASIAKDCSIMISIKPVSKEQRDIYKNEIVIFIEGCHFIVRIGVVDLGPKPSSKVESHIKRDSEAINSFLGVINC